MGLEAAFWGVAAWLALLTVALWACLAETIRLLRAPAPAPRALLPMTILKPVKGLDEGLARNFESIASADPEGRVQVVIAMESSDDPAYAVARRFADSHPDRDIIVLVTGPSGARMGKAHNMIAGLAHARHGVVVFSDCDAETTPRLLAETSRAFEEGCDAVFAAPLQRRGAGLSGVLLEIAMNHSFGLGAALGWRALGFTHCAGAWMAYTREILERSGGLEPIACAIADDFALSRRVSRAGARGRLIAAPVPLREDGARLGETLEHLAKWASIIRCSLPGFYLALPLISPGLVALALLGLALRLGRHGALAAALAGLILGSRALAAWLFDVMVGDGALALPWYVVLAFMDLGALGLWLMGFRREIRWRGTTYRLGWDGQAKVVSRDS